MDEIENFLESKARDFDIGMTLLRKYHRSRTLIANIDRRRLQAKLEYELRKISKYVPKPPTKQKTKNTPSISDVLSPETRAMEVAVTGRAKATKLDLETLPEPMLIRYHENTKMYKTCRSLHEKLKLMKENTDEERQPIATELSDMDKKIRENWNAIDTFLKQPANPPAGDPGDQAGIDHKAINAARSYISKNKNKLKDLSGSDKIKAADLRAKIQQRITVLVNSNEAISDELMVELKSLGLNFDANNAGPS